MSEKPSTPTVLIVGLMLLAGLQSAAGQALVAAPPDPPQLRTWTDRSGKFRVEAVFVESQGGKVTFKKKDGTLLNVPLETLSDPDQQYVKLSSPKVAGLDAVGASAGVAPKEPPIKKPPAWKIITNKKTGETFNGQILERKEMQGEWRDFVEGENGQTAWYPANWLLVRSAPETEPPPTMPTPGVAGSESPESAPGRSVVEINPSASTETKLMSVVVTGAGTDPDKAKYNALSNAVEQTVGVLVDAETLVENDKLVRDKVLTYTEGDVTAIKILDQSQKDGLYYVRLKATVAVQKIESRLRSQHLAVREVDGEVFYDNAKRRQENAKTFTEMLANALRDFGAEKLVKPTIVGKPEVVGQNDQFATMLVKVETQPDMENWKKVREDLLHVLRGSVRTMRSSIVGEYDCSDSTHPGFYDFGFGLSGKMAERMKYMQGDEHGYWIVLLQGYGDGKEAHSMRTQWTAHRVDKSVGPIFEELKMHTYRLHVTLIGKANNVIAEDERELKEERNAFGPRVLSSLHHDTDFSSHNFDAYCLAPFLWAGESGILGVCYSPTIPPQEVRISVPVSDLPDVARVVATIERIKEPK